MKKPYSVFFFILFIISSYITKGNPGYSNFRQNTDTVLLYDKLEIRFDLDADFRNPFDPEEIDVSATFKSPTGKE